MEFIIKRTSEWGDAAPCEGVKKKKFINIYNKPNENWVKKITTLKQLLEFKEEVEGDIIITDSFVKGVLQLEIYDDYRE